MDKDIEEKIDLLAKHKLNNHLTDLGFSVVDFKSNHEIMKMKVGYIEREVGEIKVMLGEFIKKVDEKFATKEDVGNKYQSHGKRIDKIDKIFIWIAGIIGLSIVGAILNLVIK